MRRYPERMLLKNYLMDTIRGMSLAWPTEKPVTLAPLQNFLQIQNTMIPQISPMKKYNI
jgi:hypothetical protein